MGEIRFVRHRTSSENADGACPDIIGGVRLRLADPEDRDDQSGNAE